VEIDVIVPLLQINSETKKEHHAACSILQPHSIFRLLTAVNQFQNHGSFSPESGHSTDHPFNQRFYGQTLDDY